MKFYEFITVIVVFVIVLAGILIGGQINKANVYDSESQNNNTNVGVELNIKDEKIQKIYPFTGAYYTNELAYLTKMQNVNRANMTNEFVLRTAFAKATKEDWADSYKGEGKPVEINAEILEKYINNIFGEIDYVHEDFSNKDLSIDGAITMLYECEYNEKKNTYTINFEAGDGMGDSYIEEFKIAAKQYGDKIEIIINPIYIDNIGEKKNEDGDNAFFYNVYSSYDFKTQKFENMLAEEIDTSIYRTLDNGDVEFVDEIKQISENDLEKYVLTYRLNGKTNQFEFENLKSYN